jgi:putative ATP-dependent endonuclease of OLD family
MAQGVGSTALNYSLGLSAYAPRNASRWGVLVFISRVQILNFRNFERFDVSLGAGISAIVGENGVGKTNLLYALRLVLDSDLSSTARRLDEDDFFRRCGPPAATQILISLEFSDFDKSVGAEAAVGKWLQMETNTARLTYRFRPKPTVRQAIANLERDERSLTIADYGFERVGGTERLEVDSVLDSSWNDDFGCRVVDSDVQNYLFVELPALRDAVRDLRQVRQSPLFRLLQTVELSKEDSTVIADAMAAANRAVRDAEAITGLGKSIDTTYRELTRGLNILNVRLGLTEATIPAILRSLGLLLTDRHLDEFEMSRNGLGFNNLLYAAVQIQYFKNRSDKNNVGQLLAIEEPEAHLHPHAQRNLVRTLASQDFQIFLSSHSPELCSFVGIENIVALANTDSGTAGTNLARAAALSDDEINDLNRYLDATRAALFFARRTLLVEGAAELYLIPALAAAMKVDLSAEGISVIAINGTHFAPFIKLYRTGLLGQKCAVITDGDAHTSGGSIRAIYDDGKAIIRPEGDYVSIFSNETTLEFAILNRYTASSIKSIAIEANARTLTRLLEAVEKGSANDREIARAQVQLLRLAVRQGKARFAQRLAPSIDALSDKAVPGYIRAAIDWVRA